MIKLEEEVEVEERRTKQRTRMCRIDDARVCVCVCGVVDERVREKERGSFARATSGYF